MADFDLEQEPAYYNMAEEAVDEDEALQSRAFNMAEEAEKQSDNAPGFWGTVGDIFTQAGRGALKVFTWPADVIKLGMIGEGLSDIDELEEAFQKAGKPFDRQQYIKSVLEMSEFIPTQELAEQGLEKLTGISLEPKSEFGRRAKQFSELVGFTRGGLAKKLTSATTGVAATEALKAAGVGEGKAELIGDVASLSPSLVERAPRTLSKASTEIEKTAQKHALPFLEYMAREKEPIIKGRLYKNTEARLKDKFKLSTKEAINRIISNEIPMKRLRERGINLEALGEHAYQVTEQMARAKPKQINTDQIVKNIDREILRIKHLAPSPSDAQKAAIDLLERERDVMKVSQPSSEQLINQHKNYNADMKSIYKKPEFSGKEEQARKTYEFLKNELVDAMAQQGNADVANAFKAANKIYHETSKLKQTESLINKAFNGETYNPKKLDKLLASKNGNFLRRNMSAAAIKDLEEIAKYGKEAEEKISKFIDLHNPSVINEIKTWGQLAPLVFLPHSLQGKILAVSRPVAKHVQGKLLTRDATREIYKTTLKHASEGSFNLLKKDFVNLEKEIAKEWGSVDDFIDDTLDELRIGELD
jgi:hypothetical protein